MVCTFKFAKKDVKVTIACGKFYKINEAKYIVGGFDISLNGATKRCRERSCKLRPLLMLNLVLNTLKNNEIQCKKSIMLKASILDDEFLPGSAVM